VCGGKKSGGIGFGGDRWGFYASIYRWLASVFLIFFLFPFFVFYTWAPGGSGYGYRRLVPWRAPTLYGEDTGVVIDILTSIVMMIIMMMMNLLPDLTKEPASSAPV
jgi:hypothetical protein